MSVHIIDGKAISDWSAFHNYFAEEFDFPSYYGRNMDAWNDCMSDLGDGDIVITLLVQDMKFLKNANREIYDALIECSAFVNWRYVINGSKPILALAFDA
jgi:RNAse (barnase) inhibitor barstar